MKNNHVTIEVLNPSRWYLKYSEKSKHYVQLHSSFWGDCDFLALSSDEKVMFLWILNQSLRVNKPSISICLEFAYGLLNISLDDTKDILSSLERNNIIGLPTKVRKTTKRQLIEEKKRKEKRIEEKTSNSFLVEEILELWNRNASNFMMPTVKKLNEDRLKRLHNEIKEFDNIDDWRKIFSTASKKFFTDSTGKIFTPNWDYVFRIGNCLKFYEEYAVLFSEGNIDEDKLSKSIENELINNLMV
tara:strand:- start:1092 stop:1823 length:732 start_codon:yes stop_codon:yes gene_type:complete